MKKLKVVLIILLCAMAAAAFAACGSGTSDKPGQEVASSDEWDAIIDNTIAAMTAPDANFMLTTPYKLSPVGDVPPGTYIISVDGNKCLFQGQDYTGDGVETDYAYWDNYMYYIIYGSDGTFDSSWTGRSTEYGSVWESAIFLDWGAGSLDLSVLKGLFDSFDYANGAYSFVGDFAALDPDSFISVVDSPITQFRVKFADDKISFLEYVMTDSFDTEQRSITFKYGGVTVTLPTNVADADS